ncbi:MAG TPA: ATP-binding protein [Bryobacteraceae bacterium]|nr:ATP-binding protein [Bryobacteraceae bacterium]
MRSVYAKVLLWCFGTLVFSAVAFAVISAAAQVRAFGHGGPFEKTSTWQLREAREAYESGGVEKLKDYIDRVDKHFGIEHHLTDTAGKDIVTGEDRSAWLTQKQQRPWPWPFGMFQAFGHRGEVHVMVAPASPTTPYRWIVVAKPGNYDPWSFLPYYLLVFLALGLLCWLLAVNLATPLRQLERTVDRFGRGDLSARVRSKRRDEIGNLARAFDEMAERMETLLTAERRLLQDISHELRTPLARLSFAVELSRTAQDREAATARLKKEVARLTDLVGALLQVTRAEGDPSSRNLTDLPLDDFLREVVDDCSVEAEAHGCSLQLEAPQSLHFRGDRELLRRAVENIVRNAIRYAPEGTPVEVKLATDHDDAEITVRDYGPGVPAAELPKIFKPFFRVDESRDSSTGGVGLGLAIAHRAVTVHHGTMTAKNAEPGLLVQIELPLHSE